VAVDSSAAALQYGPTEGLDSLKECIVEVMAAEGMDVEPAELLVTTGGQQVIDLVCKTLLDPGDVVIAEAPTYPGAVPVFGSYEADVRADRSSTTTACASTCSRRRSTGSTREGRGRSSSTPSRPSRTRPA
jgi:aspartate/methionine/tyrosine aminotransferase